MGGGGNLAAMLGVNASQTSRWAKGDERPGPQVAPLLIDLEHVLARVRLVWSEPAATVWMTSANARLDGACPADVLALRGVGPVLEALDAGNRFVVDSDAHYLHEFDNLDWGVAQARRAWLEPRNVLNTLPFDDFLAQVTDHQ